MEMQGEETREPTITGMLVNALRCAICDGQDGVLVRDGDKPEAYVHPYCKRLYELSYNRE